MGPLVPYSGVDVDSPMFLLPLSLGLLNDLWAFDLKTKLWTPLLEWQGINSLGIYGKQRESAAVNVPGGRSRHALVLDLVSMSLFLFGGDGYDADGVFGIHRWFRVVYHGSL